MEFLIKNDYLTVKINSFGAELASIKDNSGTEYLWLGDEKYWNGSAPILFPYIARLTDGKYTFEGTTYEMTKHGLAKYLEFTVENQKEDEITLKMGDFNKNSYPFDCEFFVKYSLIENTLRTTFIVKNHTNSTMYFGLGGHPGFNVPFAKDTKFTDYYIEFSKDSATRIGMSDDCFVTDDDTVFEIPNKKLALSHDLFDNDAIVLKEMGKSVTLKSDLCDKSIEVTFNDMNYLGIWHMPKTDAPYVCIEPWTSLPSRQDVIEDLTTQENLIKCDGDYENYFDITIK